MKEKYPTPTTEAQARRVAHSYVHWHLARDYTADRAEKEACMGSTGPGQCGWEIRRGKITVPSYGTPKWTFSFRKLAEMAEPPGEQLTLI